MKIKSWPFLLLFGIIFTITAVYWYITNANDTIGVGIFAFAATLFFLSGLGNWKSNK